MAARPRILVCPQEFKGSLDAFEATRAIAAGVRLARPDAEVVERPMADGGPGTASIVAAASGGTLVHARVAGPFGEPIDAAYAWVEAPGSPPLAVIESATVVGLALVAPEQRRPLVADSAGVGQLVLDAARRGARRIVIGCGGTASVDGGAGTARALGLRLLDMAGVPLPGGGIHLVRLARIEAPRDPVLPGVEVRVAVDVTNALASPNGAVAVYGRQKGMQDWQAPALDRALRRWAARVAADLGRDVASTPGCGAGGGLPAGVLAAVPHARLESGAALVADAIGLEAAMRSADLVVTGEGSMDAQSAAGKAVGHVAALAARLGVPCVAAAGRVESRPPGITDAEPLALDDAQAAEAMRNATPAVIEATRRLLARITLA